MRRKDLGGYGQFDDGACGYKEQGADGLMFTIAANSKGGVLVERTR